MYKEPPHPYTPPHTPTSIYLLPNGSSTSALVFIDTIRIKHVEIMFPKVAPKI